MKFCYRYVHGSRIYQILPFYTINKNLFNKYISRRLYAFLFKFKF